MDGWVGKLFFVKQGWLGLEKVMHGVRALWWETISTRAGRACNDTFLFFLSYRSIYILYDELAFDN